MDRPTSPSKSGARHTYLAPTGFIATVSSTTDCLPLAGSAIGFTAVTQFHRDDAEIRHTFGPLRSVREAASADITAWLDRLSRARPPFAGLSLDRPRLMGIVNVTPDSFSDGGRFLDSQAAIAHGIALLEAGADILDIGGESTRPGAKPVEPDDEAARVLPVIRELVARGALVSIDTRHARVMGAAIEAGARIINDVTALTGDSDSLRVVTNSQAAIVLMHMQGDPRTMQNEPRYVSAPLDVFDYLAERVTAAMDAGIPPERLCVDPGIGFGKTDVHNLEILANLSLFHGIGVPVLLGASRKGFIGRIGGGKASERLAGSLATAMAGLNQGVQILRVHDVAETTQMVALWRAMRKAGGA